MDQGRNFESALFQELCSILDIHKTRTTPYHPQSDGMEERFNRTLISILSINAANHQDQWDEILPKLMCAYRTSVHESTKRMPFSLIFGREARLPVDVMFGLPAPASSSCKTLYVSNLQQQLESSYRVVRENLGTSRERQKRRKVFCKRRFGMAAHTSHAQRKVQKIV